MRNSSSTRTLGITCRNHAVFHFSFCYLQNVWLLMCFEESEQWHNGKKNLAGFSLYCFHAIPLKKNAIQYSNSQIKYPKGGERRQFV